MNRLSLDQAQMIAIGALAAGVEHGYAPLCCVVLDVGGAILVVQRSENAAPYRVDIARAKAAGCIGMGLGGRSIALRAAKVPAFYAAVNALVPLLPVPGGVLVRSSAGELLGAVGISGDTADHDELCALAGLTAAGLVGEA